MTDNIDPLDRDALQRCMDIAMRDPDRADQLQTKLDDGQSWHDVARLAASLVQSRALRLKPWEVPPSVASEDDKDAHLLLQKMIKAGLSRYEPDPRAALLKKKRALVRAHT